MKSKNIKSKLAKANTLPGSVVYTGEKPTFESYIELISYNKEEFFSKKIDIKDIDKLDKADINWINVVGVHDTKLIQDLGEVIGIESLVLEDITTIGSRPKYDKYSDYYFILLSMLLPEKTERIFRSEQLSIIKKDNFVITFQEVEGDVFKFIRNRIQKHQGRIRESGAAYLLYCLIDSVIDQYFFIISEIDEMIESLEVDIMNSSENQHSKEIYSFRRGLMEMRTSVIPIKGIINSLIQEDTLFSEFEINYLNDLNDNINQIIDSVSIYRDLTMGLYEIYLSNISNKMNRIMTTLTIISVIFIPLTFLSSVYGMNFINIPELNVKWGYFAFWGISVLIFAAMFTFFKRKRWFL